MANGLLACVVEAIQHVVQGKFQHDRILLHRRLDDVDAAQESAVLALAERAHHGLDAVRQGHRPDEAVVHHVEVAQENALVAEESRLLPREELGHVGAGVFPDELVLGLGELLLLGLDLGVDGGFIAPALLVELADLVLVGRLRSAICNQARFSRLSVRPPTSRPFWKSMRNTGSSGLNTISAVFLPGSKPRP